MARRVILPSVHRGDSPVGRDDDDAASLDEGRGTGLAVEAAPQLSQLLMMKTLRDLGGG